MAQIPHWLLLCLECLLAGWHTHTWILKNEIKILFFWLIPIFAPV